MAEFHFLRPLWLLAFIPLTIIFYLLFSRPTMLRVWESVCDSHLLKQLFANTHQRKRSSAFTILGISALCMVIALAGPSWTRLPVPTYKEVKPKILLLDMSDSMLNNDLSPDRLSRAKFKLHDLLGAKNAAQYGLIVYSGEPFVVSPLTEDSQTIDSLLSSLAPDVMPVEGQKLETALEEAGKLFEQAGFHQGDILVLTATAPSEEAINAASTLAGAGFKVSILPVLKEQNSEAFREFSQEGKGKLLTFSDDSSDLDEWLNTSTNKQYSSNLQNEAPVWKDEGKWFLIPALIFLLPVFRKGWLQKVQQ
ncbi:TPR (repeat) domain protein (plasmid) [Legionella adelaidensis]|uniref:TPR (Repeat) domain protein n=2 Tax=Legionella adelaidensis TaxID=45056 RepID=A0A0W0R2S5_9GAMM|nr:hypothetical protein Lade_1363 [Legionella adelaidensis]VEH86008.1 TPR (repeat) domain protein [Legionella adelaidensis]